MCAAARLARPSRTRFSLALNTREASDLHGRTVYKEQSPPKRSLDPPADNFRAAQLARAALIHAAMHTVMMCPAAAASRRTAFGAVVGCSLLALAAAGLDEQGKMPEGVIGLYPSSFDMQVSNVRFCHDLLSSIDPPAAAADTPARTV